VTAPVIWQPACESQAAFLSCPVFEVLFQGTRGGGKTDCLLMDFAQFVGRGFGKDWAGILFRRTYPELEDVEKKANRWFPQIFPDAEYVAGKHLWKFRTGETLKFRHAERIADYQKYHGHEYPWIGWEELTNWATPDLYVKMMSVCRSSNPSVPRHIRATCNPRADLQRHSR
jgi:hypothetical protein